MNPTRALIFANGVLPDDAAALRLVQPGDLLIAADGGAAHIKRLGLKPHLLVGDLDSLSPDDVEALAASGTDVRRFPVEKNETDLELAIRAAHNMGCREMVVVAGMGGRMDQSLANLYLLLQPMLASLAVRMDDGCLEAMWIRHRVVLHGRAGDTVSLLPMLGQVEGIVTQHLRYPLHGETLYPEKSRGISNEMSGDEAVVAVGRGVLLCLHERKP